MLIAVSVSILLLGLIAFPFMFTVRTSGDLLIGEGEISISVFFLPIFKAKFRVETVNSAQKNVIITRGKKQDEIHLNMDKEDNKSIMKLFHSFPLASYMIWEQFGVESNIGWKENAFTTTMAVGITRLILESICAFLKNRQNITIWKRIEPSYERDELSFAAFGIIKLSIANIINSALAGWQNKLGVKSAHNGKITKGVRASVRL